MHSLKAAKSRLGKLGSSSAHHAEPQSSRIAELERQLAQVTEHLAERDLALQQLSERLTSLDAENAHLDAENALLKQQHVVSPSEMPLPDQAMHAMRLGQVAPAARAAQAISHSSGVGANSGGSTDLGGGDGNALTLQADSPYFRRMLEWTHSEIDALRDNLQKLVCALKAHGGTVRATCVAEAVVASAAVAAASVAAGFSGDLGRSFALVGTVLNEVHASRKALISSLDTSLVTSLEEFLTNEVKQVSDMQVSYMRMQGSYEHALARSLALKNKVAKDDDQATRCQVDLLNARRNFELSRFELVRGHHRLHSCMRSKLVERVCVGLCSYATSFHRLHDLVIALVPSLQSMQQRVVGMHEHVSMDDHLWDQKRMILERQFSKDADSASNPSTPATPLNGIRSVSSIRSISSMPFISPASSPQNLRRMSRIDYATISNAATLAVEVQRRDAVAINNFMMPEGNGEDEPVGGSSNDGSDGCGSPKVVGCKGDDDDDSDGVANVDADVDLLEGGSENTKHTTYVDVTRPRTLGMQTLNGNPMAENTILKQGFLWKRSTSMRKRWHRRWFLIHGGNLYYIQSHRDMALQLVCRVLTCTVRVCTTPTVRRFSFDVISSLGHRYRLQAESERQQDAWMRAIQHAIEEELGAQLPASAPSAAAVGDGEDSVRATSMACEEVMALNPVCVDCGAERPTWASINLGVVMCIECSGIHRSLGTNISKVRSLSLDVGIWDEATLALFRAVGNARFNALWEAHAGELGVAPPTATARRAEKEAWVRAKYVDAAYIAPLPRAGGTGFIGGAGGSPEDELWRAASEGDTLSALHCIGLGADVNDEGSASGRTALHEAAAAGHLPCVELLLQNGAATDAVDIDDITPLDSAMSGSHKKVVAKLVKWHAKALAAPPKAPDPPAGPSLGQAMRRKPPPLDLP